MWKGTGKSLDEAFEDAAEKAPEGEHEVKIHVSVHHNKPDETGPNPIRQYSVILGAGG